MAPSPTTEEELGPLPAEPLTVEGSQDPLVVDLETQSATHLWQGDGSAPFVRLVGTQHGISTDPAAVVEFANAGGTLVAHNGYGFDFLALAHHHGLDLLAVAEEGRLVDTMVVGLALDYPDPPKNRKKESWSGGEVMQRMALDAMAQRYGHQGKTDDLKKLAIAAAKAHGHVGKPTELAVMGYGLIPRNLPEYVDYLRGDIEATQAVLGHLTIGGVLEDYERREMRVMGRLVAGITLSGCRVDLELTRTRFEEVEARKDACRQLLVERYGLPTHTSTGEVAKNPLSCKGGPEAVDRAAADLGVVLPRTPKSGQPSTSKENLGPMLEAAKDQGNQAQADLLETILGLTGARSVYGTVLDHTHADGRVHPTVLPLQASGRFSVINPGATVLGKRGGRVVERAMFLPDHDDEVLLAGDLSQVDMRAIAAHAQDLGYLELFAPGRDAHTEIGVAVGLSREEAKAIGHGWNYGMSIDGMVRRGIERALAEKFDAGMRKRFPVLCRWRNQIRAKAEMGNRLDNGFGRMMRPNPQRAWTQAPALMGQGAARDLMMEAVLRLPLWLVPRLRFLVHDELVFSVPKERLEEARKEILEAMTFEWAPPGAEHKVQIIGDISQPGRNWAECYQGK